MHGHIILGPVQVARGLCSSPAAGSRLDVVCIIPAQPCLRHTSTETHMLALPWRVLPVQPLALCDRRAGWHRRIAVAG